MAANVRVVGMIIYPQLGMGEPFSKLTTFRATQKGHKTFYIGGLPRMDTLPGSVYCAGRAIGLWNRANLRVYYTNGRGHPIKIEVLFTSPDKLTKAISEATPGSDIQYSKINGRPVTRLSFTLINKPGKIAVVSWSDTKGRHIRYYNDNPKTQTTFNRRRSKITLIVEGSYEEELWETPPHERIG